MRTTSRVAALIATLLFARGAGAGPWTIQTADSTSGAGAYPSLQIDAAGQPHVSYGAPVLLRHAVRVGGVWSYEAAAAPLAAMPTAPGATGFPAPLGTQLINIPETALALDSLGNPAIAYANSGDSKYINFIQKVGGVWQPVESVDPGSAGEMPAIAFDPMGQACVAFHAIGYQGVGDAGLRLSTLTVAGWVVEAIDATPLAGFWPSLVFDPNGDACVLYNTGSTLLFAQRSSGIWNIDTVDVAGRCSPGALAFDPAGDAHAVYQASSSGDILHAVRHAGIWSVDTVDVNGLQASLAIDHSGRPHVAYERPPDYALRYGVRDAGVWSVESVGPVNTNNSIALAADGTPLIAYSDGAASGGALRVAIGTALASVTPTATMASQTFGPVTPQPARIGESLAISMSLAKSQAVTLIAYDVAGRLIDRRLVAPAAAGPSVLRWQPRLRTPGLYFIRMRGSAGAIGVTRLVAVR